MSDSADAAKRRKKKNVIAASVTLAVVVLLGALAAVFVLVIFDSSSSSSSNTPTPIPTGTASPILTVTPTAHPTHTTVPGWPGYPNFEVTENKITPVDVNYPVLGGYWNESRSTGYIMTTDANTWSLDYLGLAENGKDIKITDRHSAVVQGSYPGSSMFVSTTNPRDVVCSAISTVGQGNLEVMYRTTTGSWSLGDRTPTDVSRTAGVANYTSMFGYGDYINAYKMVDIGEIGANEAEVGQCFPVLNTDFRFGTPYTATSTGFPIYGFDGNDDSFWYLADELGSTGTVLFEQDKSTDGKYGGVSAQTTLGTFGTRPTNIDPTLYNLVACNTNLVVFATFVNIQVVYETNGKYDASQPDQTITLASIGLKTPIWLQLEDELMVIFGIDTDNDRAVVILGRDSDLKTYNTTNTQSFKLPPNLVQMQHLPISYDKARGVGNMLIPDALNTKTWIQWEWKLGSKLT